MILLLLSIVCSTAIYALFKLFGKFGINTLQAIVINYYVAAGFGLWYVGDFSANIQEMSTALWLPWAVLVGALFICLFYIMALVSQQFGVTVTSISSKMSLIIPVVILIAIDPEEGAGINKVIGVCLGLLAVALASAKGGTQRSADAVIALPIILFIGSGGLDFLIAMVQKTFLEGDLQFRQFTPVPFAVAALLGTLALAYRSRKKRVPLEAKNFLAGVVLGLVNYGSIYFLLRVIGSGMLDRSSAIPANNIGIVLLSGVVGMLFFQERLSAKNVGGVVLAVLSIVLLTYAPL
jgi:drug/metabolite transporter (DMT)-like permease